MICNHTSKRSYDISGDIIVIPVHVMCTYMVCSDVCMWVEEHGDDHDRQAQEASRAKFMASSRQGGLMHI